MYGLMYVEPAESDLTPVDREYYVMQSEFYHEPPEIEDDGNPSSTVEFSYPNALREEPTVVVFNEREAALTRDQPLKASVGESVRIFFRKREAKPYNPPGQFVQTVSVPPGGFPVVDMTMLFPGTYTLVDHAISRLEKDAVGEEPPACIGCKLHP
ncbi:Nitrite reductase copper-type [Penicillium paradoxum]|uniref:Nitrite reductase copper-type n=1 Tax=Penicillium paradoxum TaxID=176176 RepID=UPI002548AA0A|nr:Nitrite reductase copper-type [Penicillium paradoxum]KAJ5780074.1 Nitrite reductase copper-type [Penicillium paradoxum]